MDAGIDGFLWFPAVAIVVVLEGIWDIIIGERMICLSLTGEVGVGVRMHTTAQDY